MGTPSLTYIYNSKGRLTMVMYNQFDGYLSVHGYDLAIFLKSSLEKAKKKDDEYFMDFIFYNIVEYFKENGEEIQTVPHDAGNYWCHEYQYHIYVDKVKIVGLEKDIEVDWRTDEFEKLCISYEDSDMSQVNKWDDEDDEEDEDEEEVN